MRWDAWSILSCAYCAAFLGWPHKAADAQSTPPAAEEIRDYEVCVRDKPAGNMSVQIVPRQDGTTIVCTEAKVKLNYLVYSYRYEFHGSELWRGNRLESVDNHAVDDGKVLLTRATNRGDHSTIEVKDKSPTVGPLLVMTTNYWHAPDRPRGSQLALLDADQGTVHVVRVESVTTERIPLQGQTLDCTHYRLTGDIAADLWFDTLHRLVRQKTVEDGYPVKLQLTRITTRSPAS